LKIAICTQTLILFSVKADVGEARMEKFEGDLKAALLTKFLGFLFYK
jgi:hypothetical protein